LRSREPQLSDLAFELIGDVARALRPGTEVSHRARVALFGGTQPIDAHAKKALVERGDGLNRRLLHVGVANRCGGGHVPGVLAPLWDAPAVFRGYLDSLLLDRRGFPREVLCEIQMLSDHYRRVHPPATPDVWDDVPERLKSVLARRG